MPAEQKRITILFLDSSPDLGLATPELQTWLDQQFEVGLIAQTTADVIKAPLGGTESSEIWKTVAQKITSEHSSAEAFIIITNLESLLTTSAAISFMVQGLGKSLIFSSSPNNIVYSHTDQLTKDFGFRANLLNALQVATLNLSEPAIVFGNRIIRATRTVRAYDSSINIFQSFQTPLLGNIDFGVHLSGGPAKQPDTPSIIPVFEPKLFTIDVLTDISHIQIPDGVKGIISRTPLTKDWIDLNAKGRPIFIWSSTSIEHPLVIQVDGMTWEAAVIKFGWILAQTQDVTEIRQLMLKNYIGELGE